MWRLFCRQSPTHRFVCACVSMKGANQLERQATRCDGLRCTRLLDPTRAMDVMRCACVSLLLRFFLLLLLLLSGYLSTSLLPFGPPLAVTEATRGGAGRCSTHAQSERLAGTRFSDSRRNQNSCNEWNIVVLGLRKEKLLLLLLFFTKLLMEQVVRQQKNLDKSCKPCSQWNSSFDFKKKKRKWQVAILSFRYI